MNFRPGIPRYLQIAEALRRDIKGEGGTVMKTSLDHTKEAALQAALAEVKASIPAAAPA